MGLLTGRPISGQSILLYPDGLQNPGVTMPIAYDDLWIAKANIICLSQMDLNGRCVIVP